LFEDLYGPWKKKRKHCQREECAAQAKTITANLKTISSQSKENVRLTNACKRNDTAAADLVELQAASSKSDLPAELKSARSRIATLEAQAETQRGLLEASRAAHLATIADPPTKGMISISDVAQLQSPVTTQANAANASFLAAMVAGRGASTDPSSLALFLPGTHGPKLHPYHQSNQIPRWADGLGSSLSRPPI
jgi:hypothetical protein